MVVAATAAGETRSTDRSYHVCSNTDKDSSGQIQAAIVESVGRNERRTAGICSRWAHSVSRHAQQAVDEGTTAHPTRQLHCRPIQKGRRALSVRPGSGRWLLCGRPDRGASQQPASAGGFPHVCCNAGRTQPCMKDHQGRKQRVVVCVPFWRYGSWYRHTSMACSRSMAKATSMH